MPNSRRAVALSGLLAAVAISGCGKRSEPPVSPAEPTPSVSNPVSNANANLEIDTPTRVDKVQSLAMRNQRTIGETDHVDWDTENLSSETDKALKKLAEHISSQHPIKEHHLSELFAPNFKASVPADNQFISVYDGAVFSTQRTPNGAKQRSITSAAEVAIWLRQLSGTASAADSKQIKFKTYGVQTNHDESVQTTVWMRARIANTKGMKSVSSIWNCQWHATDGRIRLLTLDVEDVERTQIASNRTLFTDCTELVLGGNESYQAQLTHGLNHWLDRLELYDGIIATSYHGIAIGDVNNDGMDDIYLCQPGGAAGGLPNRMFLQQPDGTAIDVSAESGTDWTIETHSALIVDLDNDGHQDLVAATIAGLVFAKNDGKGHFHPMLHKLLAEAPTIAIAASDYDNDGDLDIYAASYGRRENAELMGRPVPYHDADNGARNALFRNDRSWRFTNVTKHVGLEQNNTRFSLACSWEDFDNDGDQDLYVANDFGRNNLYRNDDGRFTDVAEAAKVEDMSAGMSVAWGDYNNDGRSDLYVSNMWSSAGNRIAYQRRFLNPNAPAATRTSFQRHARGNSLFQNGGTTFRDVSLPSNTTKGGWAWSSGFIDINNDGWEDLVVANGYITQGNSHDL